MKLNDWIHLKISGLNNAINDFKEVKANLRSTIKELRNEKSLLGRKSEKNLSLHEEYEDKITKLQNDILKINREIYLRKSDIDYYKNILKIKPVRTKLGAVVNSKVLSEMIRKLKSKRLTYSIEYLNDGIKLHYENARLKTKGVLTLYALYLNIPDNVELALIDQELEDVA